MPSLTLYRSQYHLASDSMPFLGVFLFVPSFALLICYAVFLAIWHSPPPASCTGSQPAMRQSVVFGMLGLAVFNVLAAALMIVIGLQGTPFEPSKRRAMVPLLYIQAVKWVAGIGFSAYCFWAVYNIDVTCWTTDLLRLMKGTLWGSMALYTTLLLFFYFALNVLADYSPEKRWQIRLKKLSHMLGCYSTLTQAGPGQETSGETPLEELAAWFSRFFGNIDLEKSDVLAGLALVEIMQVHQRKTVIAERLHQHGAIADSSLQEVEAKAARAVKKPGQEAEQAAAGASRQQAEAGGTRQEAAGASQQQAEAGGSRRQSGDYHSPQPDVEIDMDGLFRQWMRDVSGGARECLTPSHWGAKLAPQLTPRQSAEIYTGCKDYVSMDSLVEVQRFLKYAIAAYGVPLSGSKLAWTVAAARALAGAKEPMQQQLQGDAALLKAYVAAQQIANISRDNFIHLSFANAALGLTPYMIVLDRASRTVVLAVRGSNSMEDLLTDMMDRPVNITDWVPAALRQKHPDCASDVFAHMGMYSAAKAVLQDLNQHQILPILLTGAPLASDERQRQQARHAPDERQLRWQEHRLARHSLDPNVGREGKKQKQGQKVQPGLWSRQLSGWDSDRSDWGSLAGGDSLDLHAAVSLPAGIGMGGVSFQAAPEQQRQTQDLGGAAGHMSGALVGDKLGNADPAAAHGSNGNHASTISTQGGKGGSQQRLEERLSPADYQRMLQGRGLDCRGWKLVVTGHSLGAAVAALVGMHLRDWCPGTQVFAFDPPGGMTTANLAHAVEGFVTSVCVGKDSISRLGTLTFDRIMDQLVIALARTRLTKLRVLGGLRSKALRSLSPEELFHPIDRIPPEPLNILRQYFSGKCRFSHLFVPMLPPGRVMMLRRLKGPAAGRPEGNWRQRRHQQQRGYSWDAVWIEQSEQLIEEGILLSQRQASDHYTARLMQVLGELTRQAPTAQQAAQEGRGED